MKLTIVQLCLLLCLLLIGCSAVAPAPAETEAPTQITAPPTTVPPETTEPTEAPTETTVPQPEEFLLSFAGDCCLGNLRTWSWDRYFIGTVGEDYDYPFSNVLQYFQNDSATFVNLENPLTDSTSYANKKFVFRGPTSYTRILTQGSIEFANVANNHSMDCGTQGYQDTLAVLNDAGIFCADARNTTVFTTQDGLTVGVYADLYPENVNGLPEKIEAMRAEGAEVIIVSMHWGREYYYKPNSLQESLAHAAIDAGADIVYGHHPHVLQPIEEYNGKIIFYSLGNFCFGGNTNPTDKDSAILQQQIIRDPDGTVSLGELTIIPCSVSSVQNTNDFKPTPYEEDSDAWKRALSKLDGSYPYSKISVDYRPELG